MDTSETYIKMCEKAVEVQRLDKRDMGSIYWSLDEGLCLLVYPSEKIQYGWEQPWYEPSLVSLADHRLHAKDHHSFWLPRQDQLQEMVGWEDFRDSHYTEILKNEGQSLWVVAFEQLAWFANDNPADEWSFDNKLKYGSMEQLWLAFVMKEKYDKVWDGVDWITSISSHSDKGALADVP